MTNEKQLYGSENQCELSYELLYLLKWLVDHEAESLKKIIVNAINQGATRNSSNIPNDFATVQPSEVQHSIIEFLDLLDALLLEAVNEKSIQQAMQKNLMPALGKIDTTICDKSTVQTSLDRATAKLETNPNQNFKELMYKELLKRWKPNKKNS